MTPPGPVGERRIWTIYCEGFQDRDFLAGMLEQVVKLERPPRGEQITGVFTFRSPTTELRVRQCGSKPKAVRAFKEALDEADSLRPAGLVMCLDERDEEATPTAVDALRSARDRLHGMVATAIAIEPTLTGSTFDRATGTLRLVDGAEVRLASITWCCDDEPSDHYPDRQNLERLITAACCEAYPERGAAVHAWLASRHEPPTTASDRDKAFSWSHMAGWYPSPGGNEFFRAIWRDARIRAALCRRMQATGIDALLTSLGITPPWADAAAPGPSADDTSSQPA